jgi:hypothetical protein
VSRATVGELVRQGFDVTAERDVANGVQIDLVLSAADKQRLTGRGVEVGLWHNRDGKTATQLAAAQSAGGFNVWRSFDQPGGIRDEIYDIAKRNPRTVKLEVLGHTLQGREILAVKVTKHASKVADGSRPSVLYISTQHAREWISTEVNRRLLHHFVDGYGRDAETTKMVNTRELWFVLVANPDGYQYTFEHERLWRKNLHDNDGNGQITNADGVDPNRNFDEHWNYDNEGSSSEFGSETFRGKSAASEAETQAMQGLLGRLKPTFVLNYHSYGPLILYPFGWQVQTPAADDPIYAALSGTDTNPAIPGFNPGVSADLYTTNGETTDYATVHNGSLPWTVELDEGIPGNGFLFPDDESLIQHEYEINEPFALDMARSAPDPTRPASHQGNTIDPLVPHKFSVSYGDPQTVEVDALRRLGAVTVKYRVNGGATRSAATSEWNGGKRYGGPGDLYYREMRGQVKGTKPGDDVEVWFEARGSSSAHFTYHAAVESSNPVLILSAEDYTGLSPVYQKTDGPSYLSYYRDALDANGIGADVYDVDAMGRKAPDPLGVLGHYKAVVWYTGDDLITREPGMLAGTASRLANDEMLAVRSYLNDGGRLFYSGKNAGYQYAFGYEFDPVSNAPCDPSSSADGCTPLSDDFLQYYLGAYTYNDDAGTSASGTLYDVLGKSTPFGGLNWAFGAPSANNQDHSASFLTTTGLLPDQGVGKELKAEASSKYDRPGGPYEPHSGSQYVYSGVADRSYKRLTRTVDLTGKTSGSLSFWVSRDTEQDWDFMFVEAHTVGQDDWTTLPDQNGHTTTATGESCPAGWINELHPHLAHYQTLNADGITCSPTGTTGSWNAASGNSGGWEQWSVDLSAYAGKQVELSISYASDWSSQRLGVFLDDTTASTGESTSFEDGLGGWAVPGPPPGSAPATNDFAPTTAAGFPEGATVTTLDTVYAGFGLEGISTPAARNAVMGRAIGYLLR